MLWSCGDGEADLIHNNERVSITYRTVLCASTSSGYVWSFLLHQTKSYNFGYILVVVIVIDILCLVVSTW
jgi:hypothetical protein